MSRSRRAFHHVFVLALGAWSTLLLGARCAGQVGDQVSTSVDAMLDGDWLDPRTGTAAVQVLHDWTRLA